MLALPILRQMTKQQPSHNKMYFIYLKSSGAISPPVQFGKPDDRSLNKETDCGIGSGVKWNANDLFYAPDEEFPEHFARTAPLGKYSINNDTIEENTEWVEEEDDNE